MIALPQWSKRLLKQIMGLQFRRQLRLPTERHGSAYGGWCIFPGGLDEDSIVYSFGVGNDITFDLSLIKAFGLQVYAFDPTPATINWIAAQTLPYNFRFYPYGIANYDGHARFNPPDNPAHISHTMLNRRESSRKAIVVPVFRLQTVMRRLGHGRIAILKMDVEGAEYSVIEDLCRREIPARQVLVEFHHHYPEVKWEESRRAASKLKERGFRIFCVSEGGYEVSFIKDAS